MTFPALTVDGETVQIERKEFIANQGEYLYATDGRVFKRRQYGLELEEQAEKSGDLEEVELLSSGKSEADGEADDTNA